MRVWTDDQKKDNIRQFLDGPALIWHTDEIKLSSNPPTDWTAFKTLFLERFLPSDQVEEKKKLSIKESNKLSQL